VKIIVRDDDTCGFTRPEEILSCYQQIWQEIPVSLSVTPFRIPGNDRNLPEHLNGKMEIFPLHKNQEIQQMLREGIREGRIDVSMHGYHHLRYHGLPEYVGGDELARKTREGKTYLDKLLGINIGTFVPPNNGICANGIAAVAMAGMNLVNVPSLWSRKHRPRIARSLQLAPAYYWHRVFHKKHYPYVLELGDHKEVGYHSVGPGSRRKALIEELDYCDRHNGIFVLSTHYHAFDRKTQDGQTVRALVFDLLDRANAKQGVEFIGINAIW
jgi:peptidoglycan/xylan/chitin deacetylase (PgdA/CDA1 family)